MTDHEPDSRPGAAPSSGQRHGGALRLAWWTVGIGVLVFGLKLLAWWLTGSVALYSDALESIINIVAAIGAAIAIRVSARPPDAHHPFGHAKAEYLSAGFEGALIVAASLSILHEAWQGFQSPTPYEQPWLGMCINGAASAVNAGWAAVLIRASRRYRSAALDADARHLLTDVWTSLGVLVGVVLVVVTGWWWLDPLLAAAVALNILWTGGRLVRSSVDALMDAAPSPEVLGRLAAAIDGAMAGAIEYHDVRTRVAGHALFVQMHLVVDAGMTVGAAHALCDRIEAAVMASIEGVHLTIHVEPPDKAKRHRLPDPSSGFIR